MYRPDALIHSVRFPADEAKALRAFARRRTNGNITGLIRELVAAAIKAEESREAKT